jgi:uncharacterized phage protein gp47/JayE
MNLSLKGFSQLIEDMSAALQSSSTRLIDVSVGSVVRAIFEANASVALWLQWLILQVLQTTRATTSSGQDLDTWMMDFGLARLPAVQSTGVVTFSRYAANLDASIPVGSLVKTGDGLLSFAVDKDITLSTWSAALGGYVIPGGVNAIDLPVACAIGGSAGNVLGGTITVIAASLPGVDQVTNASALSDGSDAESDTAFRGRFQDFLASRSRATIGAIRNAVAGVRQGLNVAIIENSGADGSTQVGAFVVIVDDGTGQPSANLLSNVATAVDSVRPIGTMFAVVPPQVLRVDVSMTVRFASPGDANIGIPSIERYVTAFLDRLAIGKTASVTRVAQQAYLAGPFVENISLVLLNGGASDVVVNSLAVVKAGQMVIAVDDR